MENSQWLTEILETVDMFYILVGFVTTYGIPLSFGIALYICQGMGLSTIARRREIQNPWLAWLPLGNLWILGSISDQYQQIALEQEKTKRRTLLLLGVLCLAAAAAFGVGLWGANSGELEARFADTPPMAMAAVFMVLFLLAGGCWLLLRINAYIAAFYLFRSCTPGRAPVYLLLSIVMYMALPVMVFALRKKDEGLTIRRDPTKYYQQSRCEF